MGLIKDTAYVMLSNIISVGVNFFYYPILVRLYGFTSDIFGNFQYIGSTLGVITAYSVLAMDIAYISERKKHSKIEQSEFLIWFLIIGILIKSISVISWAIITKDMFFGTMGIILGIPQLISVSIQLLLKDEKRFKFLSLMIAIQAISNVFFGILIGFFLQNSLCLILASSLSFVVSVVIILFISAIKIKFTKPRISFLKNFLITNSNLVVFQTGSNLLNTVSFNLPVFVIKTLFGEMILGFYSLAFRLLIAVNRVMSQALSQTFLPYFSKSRSDELRIFIRFYLLAIFFYPLYLGVSLLSDFYVVLLFGSDYLEVSTMIKLLVPWLFSVAVISPYTSSFTVHKKANIGLILNILLLLSRIGSMIIGSKFSYVVSLLLFSLTSTLFFDLMLLFSFKFAKVKFVNNLLLMLVLQFSLYIAIVKGLPRFISLIPLLLFLTIVIKKRYFVKQMINSMHKRVFKKSDRK